jgi:hypothetical protein
MRRSIFMSAVVLNALFVAEIASAQNNTYTYNAPDNFQQCVTDIAASNNNSANVYALGCDSGADKTIWKRNSGGWNQFAVGSTAAQVEVSNGGVPWIRKSNGKVYRWDVTQLDWVRVGPTTNCASDFGVGGDAWELGCNGELKRVYRWNGTSWTEPQPDARASGIGVGADSLPWLYVADSNGGQVWQWNGSSFQWRGAGASVAGGGGWVVGSNGNDIWQWVNNGWVLWAELGDTVTALTGDGTFAALADRTAITQAKFDSFTVTGFPTNLTYTVVAKYFPSGSDLAWERSWDHQVHSMGVILTANAGHVINQTSQLPVQICNFLKTSGLRRSHPAQRFWVTGGNQAASLTSTVMRDRCWDVLDP